MAGGRPLKFRTAVELQRKIDAYFDKCDEENKPYSIEQLATSIGIARQTLWEYQGRDKFADAIKMAKQRIAGNVEQIMLSGKAQAGCIFWLKNHGWSDKQEIEVNDISKLSKDELIDKVKSLASIVPVRPKKQANG